MEEPKSSVFDLLLIDAPRLTQVFQDTSLLIKHLNGSLLAYVLQSDNSIADARRAQDANPANFSSVVGVSAATSFCIDSLDIYNAKGVPWNDATLVKTETEFALSLRLIHKALRYVVAVVYQTVCRVLNLLLLLTRQRLEMRDIQMCLLFRLFSTSLPNVRA